jgi:hypothetical protein
MSTRAEHWLKAVALLEEAADARQRGGPFSLQQARDLVECAKVHEGLARVDFDVWAATQHKPAYNINNLNKE